MPNPVPASARPIFIVGSPRSGTSILTWALGQHSDIFLQEESSWMGPLALQVEIAYRTGTARGERSQLSALGVERADFFTAFGEAIDRLVLSHREKLETRIAAANSAGAGAPIAELPPVRSPSASPFKITRAASDPKTRWVDGSPEYSLYIGVLRRLFPCARFIHILRDPALVARSMLNFERTGGPSLVAAEEEAYRYWIRCVRACLEAERAYGEDVIKRLHHRDLVERPEENIRELLAFLGESFEAACVEPLARRINSSDVPSDFEPAGERADSALVQEAEELFRRAEKALPGAPHPEIAEKIEQEINQRVVDLARMPAECHAYRDQIRILTEQLRTRPRADELREAAELQTG